MQNSREQRLSNADLLELRRWNTPTVYNGWEQITRHDAGLDGLVIAGVFAAAMSSLDSSIHSVSTSVTTDFLRRFKPNLSVETYLAVARGLTVFFGITGTVAAMLMAVVEVEYLWDLFLGIMGLFGGTLAGLFLLGVFTKNVRTSHAWFGAVAGVAMLLYVKLATNLSGLLYGAIGVVVCFLVALGASRIRRPRSRQAG